MKSEVESDVNGSFALGDNDFLFFLSSWMGIIEISVGVILSPGMGAAAILDGLHGYKGDDKMI